MVVGGSSREIVIASVERTPIAKFRGSLSSLKASEQGGTAIKGTLGRLPLPPRDHPGEAIQRGNGSSSVPSGGPCIVECQRRLSAPLSVKRALQG